MKKISIYSVLILSIILLSASVQAQKKITEGSVILKLEADESNEDQFQFGDNTMEYYFSGAKIRCAMKMMGGLIVMQSIEDKSNEENNGFYVDHLGHKIEVISDSDAEVQLMTLPVMAEGFEEVEYVKNDRKTILGYDCYKTKILNNDGSSATYYITEKILPKVIYRNKKANLLKGFPLELRMLANGTEVVYTASELKKNSEVSDFELQRDQYTKMTMAEYQKKVQNGEFGFD